MQFFGSSFVILSDLEKTHSALPFPIWAVWLGVFSIFLLFALVLLSYRNVSSTHFDPLEEEYAKELLEE